MPTNWDAEVGALGEGVQEEFLGLAALRERLDSLVQYLEASVSDGAITSTVLSHLSAEVGSVSEVAQRCVRLQANLKRLNDRLGEWERTLERRIQDLSGHEAVMRKLHDLEFQLDDQERQLEGIGRDLDCGREQLEVQSLRVNEQARQLGNQGTQMAEQTRQLGDKGTQMAEQSGWLERMDGFNSRLDGLCERTEALDIGVAGSQNQGGQDQARDAVIAEVAKVHNAMSNMQADIGKLVEDLSARETVPGRLANIEELLRSPRAGGGGALLDPAGAGGDLPSTARPLSGQKRKRERSKFPGADEADDDATEWQSLMRPLGTAFDASAADTRGSDVSMARLRRMIFMYLGSKDESGRVLGGSPLEAEWVRVSALCSRGQFFSPGNERYIDCAQDEAQMRRGRRPAEGHLSRHQPEIIGRRQSIGALHYE